MQVKAAVHYQAGQPVEIEMLDLDEPRALEVRGRYVASGVCHSDLHHIQGLVPHPTPVIFGHEGAGIVAPGWHQSVKKGSQDVYQYLQFGTYSQMATVPDVSVIPIRKSSRT